MQTDFLRLLGAMNAYELAALSLAASLLYLAPAAGWALSSRALRRERALRAEAEMETSYPWSLTDGARVVKVIDGRGAGPRVYVNTGAVTLLKFAAGTEVISRQVTVPGLLGQGEACDFFYVVGPTPARPNALEVGQGLANVDDFFGYLLFRVRTKEGLVQSGQVQLVPSRLCKRSADPGEADRIVGLQMVAASPDVPELARGAA